MKSILKKAALYVAAIALTFGLQNCSTVKPIDKKDLTGYWELKSLKGEDSKSAFSGKLPSIEFDFDKNIAHGNGGCNNYTGAFTINEKNEFSAPNFAATMMACLQSNKEPEFLSTLSTPNLIVGLNESGALIFSQGKNVVLEFIKGTAPTKANSIVSSETLTGNWKLTTIAGGDIADLFAERVPNMSISSDGNISGKAGCNTYRTSYKQEENTLTFGPAISTKMACPNLKGEQLYLSFFNSPLQAGINGDKLTFFKGGNVVLEFTKDTSSK